MKDNKVVRAAVVEIRIESTDVHQARAALKANKPVEQTISVRVTPYTSNSQIFKSFIEDKESFWLDESLLYDTKDQLLASL